MRASRRQFGLSGAAMGALLPYLPRFLLDRLGDPTRVGVVPTQAVADVSMLTMFNVSAGVTVVAGVMLWVGFRVNRSRGRVA